MQALIQRTESSHRSRLREADSNNPWARKRKLRIRKTGKEVRFEVVELRIDRDVAVYDAASQHQVDGELISASILSRLRDQRQLIRARTPTLVCVMSPRGCALYLQSDMRQVPMVVMIQGQTNLVTRNKVMGYLSRYYSCDVQDLWAPLVRKGQDVNLQTTAAR